MNEHDLTSLVAGNELSPQAVVDEASITNCMSKNKESLQKKLMLRRPVDVLVDQGILPRKWSPLIVSCPYSNPLSSSL